MAGDRKSGERHLERGFLSVQSLPTAASGSRLSLFGSFQKEREESRMNQRRVGKKLIIKQKDKTIFE